MRQGRREAGFLGEHAAGLILPWLFRREHPLVRWERQSGLAGEWDDWIGGIDGWLVFEERGWRWSVQVKNDETAIKTKRAFLEIVDRRGRAGWAVEPPADLHFHFVTPEIWFLWDESAVRQLARESVLLGHMQRLGPQGQLGTCAPLEWLFAANPENAIAFGRRHLRSL